jgi:hypothetical protein
LYYDEDMNERQEQLIEHFVAWIKAKGLRSPAILLLEANKPLALIGGQALLFAQPLLGLVGTALGWPVDREHATEWATLLEDPAGIDHILERLEGTESCSDCSLSR